MTDGEHADPTCVPVPRFWVPANEVDHRLGDRWSQGWLFAWRGVTSATNERTIIPTVLPRTAVGHSLFLLFPHVPTSSTLVAAFSTFCFDFIARQKLGGINASFFTIEQLAVPRPELADHPTPWSLRQPLEKWIGSRLLELVYTSCDISPYARNLGYDGPPFQWDPDRRTLVRCELDAAFFHLYGIPREGAAYILDTFPIVREKDEKRFGEYRSKRVILECYDAMRRAMDTGEPYQTILDPPPADARVAHRASPSVE